MNQISKDAAKEIIDEADSGAIMVVNAENPAIIGDADIRELDFEVEVEGYLFS